MMVITTLYIHHLREVCLVYLCRTDPVCDSCDSIRLGHMRGSRLKILGTRPPPGGSLTMPQVESMGEPRKFPKGLIGWGRSLSCCSKMLHYCSYFNVNDDMSDSYMAKFSF